MAGADDPRPPPLELEPPPQAGAQELEPPPQAGVEPLELSPLAGVAPFEARGVFVTFTVHLPAHARTAHTASWCLRWKPPSKTNSTWRSVAGVCSTTFERANFRTSPPTLNYLSPKSTANNYLRVFRDALK